MNHSSLLLLALCVASATCWSYANSRNWPQSFPKCAGDQQSPIDLPNVCRDNSKVTIDRNLTLEFHSYNTDQSEKRLDLLNTGHTMSLQLRNSAQSPNDGSPGITFNGTFYQFAELHFHWDHNDTQGSEHTISGERSASELHLVHYNTKYKGLAEATGKKDGLLVLGILLTTGWETNDALQPILSKVTDVLQPGIPAFLQQPINLMKMLPANSQTFYYYSGSLTTPPCTEPVSWIVFEEKAKISYFQLANLERMSDGEDKRREIQPLKGRKVFVSSDRHCYE